MNSWVKPEKQAIFIAESTKKQFLLTNSGVITSILGVAGPELHSCSTEPVNFFGAQFSLGRGGTILVWGAQAVIWGEHGHGMPSGGAGPVAHAASRVTFHGYFKSTSTKQYTYKVYDISRQIPLFMVVTPCCKYSKNNV